MKRVIILALVSITAILVITGCNDESKPHFTRLNVTPACGVVPLKVDGYAIASGGDESGSPTGGNNNLEIKWNFADGGSSFSSIAFHEYVVPGTYTVVVTGTDNSGNVTSISQEVTVLEDSLAIEATIIDHEDLNVTTTDTLRFDVWASACSVDPDTPEDYRKLDFKWEIAGQDTFYAQNPVWMFDTAGQYTVYNRVTITSLAVTRWDTMVVNVTDP